MSASLSDRRAAAPLANRDIRGRMAKAALTVGENDSFRAELRLIGECLDEARRVLGWSVDQLSAELDRDSKQVGRWMRGEERTQVDVVFSVPVLRQPFVVALAKRAGCEVTTTVKVRIA